MSIRAARARRSALHPLCAGLAAGALFVAGASEAHAQEPASAPTNAVAALVKVHIESPEEVDLEMKKDDDWVKVCTSPCDAVVPTSGVFRINGAGVRASKAFRLEEPGATTLAVEPASSAAQVIAVTLVIVGGTGLLPAAGVTGLLAVGVAGSALLICPIAGIFGTNYFECIGEVGVYIARLYAEPVVWIPAAAALAPIIGGGAWLASSSGTQVTPRSPWVGTAARAPEWRAPRELDALGPTLAVATTPLVSFTF